MTIPGRGASGGTYPVLVLQMDEDEGLDLFEPALAADGRGARVVDVWNGERVPSTVSGHSALVVLGGPQAAYQSDHVEGLRQAGAAIKEAHATRTPVLGVCLGAQLAAHVLGGAAFRGEQPEIGVTTVALAQAARTDKVLRFLDPATPVVAWHGDTYRLPADARRLAENAAFAEQAFVLDPDVYGLQFHVEWSAATVARLVQRHDAMLQELGVDGAALVADATRSEEARRKVADAVFGAFLETCGCHD